jgi:aldehyde dehydrogenase (NAD+)
MIDSIKENYSSQVAFYNRGETLNYNFRLKQLSILEDILLKKEADFIYALKGDLGKCAFESVGAEIGLLQKEVHDAKKKLKQWMSPKRVKTNFLNFLSSSWIYPEPRGNCLILAPWNYPLLLSLSPAIGAIAAGNTIFLRPSEFTPLTSELLCKTIGDHFPEEYFSSFVCDAQTTGEILDQKWSYIFFTGSTKVGKIVYEKAAKNLTPCILELGGKSPAIVDKDADLENASLRIT